MKDGDFIALPLPPNGDFVLSFGMDEPLSDHMRDTISEQVKWAMRSGKPIMVAPELRMEVTPILPRNLAALTFPA